MMNTGRALSALLVATSIVIAGCDVGSDVPAPSSPLVPAPAPATAVSQLPTATPTPTYSGEPPDAVLIEWIAWTTTSGQMIPLDSDLGTASAPAPLVQSALAFASPDGSLVAVSDTAGLAVYRVERWEQILRAEEIRGPARPMWTRDGGRIYAINNSRRLFEVTVATGAVRDVGWLANPLIDAALSPDASTVFAVAYEGDLAAIDVRTVHLAAIDTTTGDVKRRAELGTVVVGQRAEQSPTPKYWASYSPALALSPDGRRAYIANSDSEAVTVVDLDSMSVGQAAAMEAPRSRWERFTAAVGGLFVSRAEAKGGLYFRREAMVSPDGRWLYVTGSIPTPCGPLACEDDAPAGLWVLDTRTMRVVHREEGINHIAMSFDGTYIAGTGTSYSQEKGKIGRGAKVLRAGTWERVLHFEPGAVLQSPAFTADGEGLLVVSPAEGLEYANTHGGHCVEACYRLSRVDLRDGRVLATRDLFGSAVEVTALPGRKPNR